MHIDRKTFHSKPNVQFLRYNKIACKTGATKQTMHCKSRDNLPYSFNLTSSQKHLRGSTRKKISCGP